MTQEANAAGSSLWKKLLILLVLAGVAYVIVSALGEDSGGLQTYDGFS